MNTAEGRWGILIEESAGGYRGRMVNNPAEVPAYPTRDIARQAAYATAREYMPSHPSAPRQRTVLRRSPDEYTVIVKGMIETHHYHVSVVELLS
ncbi:hypothetical protein [Nocardiopsis potens]|uniref:hypothetical protein n=1 Tax=Nocardiopsis potens TaxID=1246458 RepID=UPI000348B3A0|nr:hypothetical protein [Nocardiopsis potens]